MALQLSYTDANGIEYPEAYARIGKVEYIKDKQVLFNLYIYPSVSKTVLHINGKDRVTHNHDIVNKNREVLDETGETIVAIENDFVDYGCSASARDASGNTIEHCCYEYLKGQVPAFVNAIDV